MLSYEEALTIPYEKTVEVLRSLIDERFHYSIVDIMPATDILILPLPEPKETIADYVDIVDDEKSVEQEHCLVNYNNVPMQYHTIDGLTWVEKVPSLCNSGNYTYANERRENACWTWRLCATIANKYAGAKVNQRAVAEMMI